MNFRIGHRITDSQRKRRQRCCTNKALTANDRCGIIVPVFRPSKTELTIRVRVWCLVWRRATDDLAGLFAVAYAMLRIAVNML